MLSTTMRKTITTPEFTIRGGVITATVPSQIVEVRSGDVFLQISPCLMQRIGHISKDGTGWTAVVGTDNYLETTPSFTGDHFPTRTGKHTKVYALCHLVARAAGFDSSSATYDLKYDGVRA